MELEINGVKADLGNATIAITRESFSVENPENRFISITNSVNLPDTEINRTIFNSPAKINSTNDSFDVLYLARVIDQTILFDGYGILTEGKEREGFQFQLIDKSKDVFNQLERQIDDFDWDIYDIYHNTTDQAAIETESINNPICWPRVCFHQKKIVGNLGLEYSRPSAYLPGILNLKLLDLGYSFSTPIKLAASMNHDDFLFTSYEKTLNYSITGGNDLTGLDVNDFEHSSLLTTSTYIDFGPKKTRIRIRGSIEITGTETLYLVVEAYDSAAAELEIQKYPINPTDTEIDIITADYKTSVSIMEVSFSIEGTGSIQFNNTLLYSLHPEEDAINLDTNPFDEFKIKVKDNLPNMTFKDIYKTICITTNSTHNINTFDKSFEFKSFAGVKKLRSLDWSDKFIQNTESINNDYGNLAKKNWLKYDNDETVNRLLGADYFNTNNENLEDEKDYLTLPFGASEETVISAVSMIAIDVYNDTQRIPEQTINIRLYKVDSGLSSFLSWEILKPLYQNIFNSLLRVRAIECEMDLKKLDVMGWDLVQLIYIDYYSSHFILLSIDDFVSGTPTQVKLLKYG